MVQWTHLLQAHEERDGLAAVQQTVVVRQGWH
jgi:hypothetical protein